jgi:branched-chain amino acid aminotransferase
MALGERALTWYEGAWHDGNAPIIGAADHGAWLGTLVFDGARAFEGVTPDLDLHCARLIRSAAAMGLAPSITAGEIEALILEGVRRLGPGRPLYLRPMMWSREGSPALIDADPASTAFAICLEDYPFRPAGPFSLTVSPYRRPPPDSAISEAKAACHYANNARIITEARSRGFTNALSLDQDGHVAETASTNAFLVRDGEVLTPVPNGTFLAGITRQRVMALLRADGRRVVEARLDVADFAAADEIFLTGNAGKVTPVTRFETRPLGAGPMAARARALYWDYAHQTRSAA